MEVGVNFLVVTIICLALLGIGIFLMSKFTAISEKQLGEVDEANQQKLIRLLSTGRVALIPSVEYINKGETAKFSLGVTNELGAESYFSIFVEERSRPIDAYENVIPQYSQTAVYLKNNMNNYWLIAIKIPRANPKGTYIFNVYVCREANCYKDPAYNDPYYTDKYGELQQIQINVR